MRLHFVSLAALLALASALPCRAGDAQPTLLDRSEKTADVRGLAGLNVDNARGRVSLRPSTDGRLHLIATRIFRTPDVASAKRLAAETSVSSGPSGGSYAVEVHYPRRIESGFSFFDLFSERGRRRLQAPSVEVVLELDVPASMPVHVTTLSGDVSAVSLAAPVVAAVTSGDVVMNDVRGRVDVKSVSGDVTLAAVGAGRVRTTSGDVSVVGTGALDCETVSGDIGVQAARDSLLLGSQSGDVTVDDAPAGVRAHSVSGEVSVRGACGHVSLQSTSGEVRTRLRSPLRAADLSSISGNVTVALVSGMGAHLVAGTTSGTIDCSLPMAVTRHDRNHLEARIGAGGPAIHIGTVSGNLTVTSGGK